MNAQKNLCNDLSEKPIVLTAALPYSPQNSLGYFVVLFVVVYHIYDKYAEEQKEIIFLIPIFCLLCRQQVTKSYF